MIRATILALLFLALLLWAFAPALAQPETVTIGGPEARGQFGRVGIGGFTASPLTVIDRNPKAATLSVYRFNGGNALSHEVGSRFYCHEDEAATGSSYCVSIEVESYATAHSIGRPALNVKARRRKGAKGRVSAIHVAGNDWSGLSATEAQGIILVESGLEVYGPDDYRTPLGTRHGWRFAAKGDGETGTGWAALTGSRWPRATLNTGFFAAEVNGYGRINAGFRCDIEGTCLVVERARFAMDLNGSDIILRRREDGSAETLRVELARLRSQVAQLRAHIARLDAIGGR